MGQIGQRDEGTRRDDRRAEARARDVEQPEGDLELVRLELVGADHEPAGAQRLRDPQRRGAGQADPWQLEGGLGPQLLDAPGHRHAGRRQAAGEKLGHGGADPRMRVRRLGRLERKHQRDRPRRGGRASRRRRQQDHQRGPAHAGSSMRAGGRTQAWAAKRLRSRKPRRW